MNLYGGPVDLKKSSFQVTMDDSNHLISHPHHPLRFKTEESIPRRQPPVRVLIHYSVAIYSFENFKILTSILCCCSKVLYYWLQQRFSMAYLGIQ